MELIAWAVLILFFSGAAAWTVRRRPWLTPLLGAGGCLTAGTLGLWSAGSCLFLRQLETRRALWNAPFASFSIGLDSLSAVFLVPVFLIGALAALYAARSRPGAYATNHPHEHWLFFNLTLGGAALAIVARNAVLFLFAWELMTVASFLLVENRQREAGQRGGWVYLVAGHIGGACLFAMFALWGAGNGFEFAQLKAAGWTATAVFALAFVGFGGKFGLAPLHAWYPESYPQSPAHVGALLSGVVGNLGLYGLCRTLFLLGDGQAPPRWWGYLLLLSGMASAVAGAARSLASKDLFRLLAWSSLENNGLMAAGLGMGLLGAAADLPAVALLGFAAALLHMLNHSVSKSLLFLASGDLLERTGTRDLDRMGGLFKRLPLTGLLFLIGGLGAAAVPPLNGFASEFLLLMAAYNGAAGYRPASVAAAAMVAAIALLALAGGLAAAAYVKAFGFAFLGGPRGPGAASGGTERRSRLLPHLALAFAALALAGSSPQVLNLIRPVAEVLCRSWGTGGGALMATWSTPGPGNPLSAACLGSWLLAACLGGAALLRWLMARSRAVRRGPTWDCGYAAPDARMQYTASSFARPLADSFQVCVNNEDRGTPPAGIFPGPSSFSSATPGVEKACGFAQLFAFVSRIAARIRTLQSGKVQSYLLYIALALVLLLLWKL